MFQVRQEAIKVIHLLLSKVNLEKIYPFFGILSTYLRSAMTHIDSRIQESSLLFLDVLLQCTPKLIAQDFHKIMPNFLDMISKIKMDSKQGRTLTVNLNSQITSVKWRVKVFHRLQQFLFKFAELNELFKAEQKTDNITHDFNVESRNNFPLFNPIYTSVCSVSCFSPKASNEYLMSDEIENFKSYIETLMPLLFEIWLEACPNAKSDKNIETVLNEDAAVLLKHTLKVISLIWNLVEYFNKKYPSSKIQDIFTKKYRSSFSQHFVTSFPYVTNIRSKSSKPSDTPPEDVITDSKLVTENLEICHLFISINPNINFKKHHVEITSVLKYIEKNFSNQFQDSITETVIKILHTIFSKEVTSWTRTYNVMESLFRKIIYSYFNENLSNIFKQQIFGLLCKVAINNNLVNFHTNDAYETWLKNLPDILLNESINTETVDILFKFAVTNNKVFNSVVKHKLKEIINNLPNINIYDSQNDRSYCKLLSLLYWVNVWNDDSFNLLVSKIMANEFKSDYNKYILDMLKCRSGIM